MGLVCLVKIEYHSVASHWHSLEVSDENRCRVNFLVKRGHIASATVVWSSYLRGTVVKPFLLLLGNKAMRKSSLSLRSWRPVALIAFAGNAYENWRLLDQTDISKSPGWGVYRTVFLFAISYNFWPARTPPDELRLQWGFSIWESYNSLQTFVRRFWAITCYKVAMYLLH